LVKVKNESVKMDYYFIAPVKIRERRKFPGKR
jgi:hypothetical protein